MDNYFDGEHSPEKFSSLEESRKKLFHNRLKKISRYFPKKQKISLLDVGAATGQFVHQAISNNFEAIGIELSAEAREEAQKKYSVHLSADSLDKFCKQKCKFDVIHMNHVFEHILDPGKCLQQCNHLLNQKGLLVVEVPQQFQNDLDRLKNILSMTPSPSFNPYSLHHTYFYTPKTLTLLLGKYNFAVCKLRTANLAYTPLYPPRYKNFILALYLFISDKLHKGGNIIEVFSRKK
jgi:SAM-dependent methyltransferase